MDGSGRFSVGGGPTLTLGDASAEPIGGASTSVRSRPPDLLGAAGPGGFGVPASHAGGAPTLSVSPTKNLIDPLGDGAFVRAEWTNMPPDGSVYLRQCTQHPKDVKDDCSQTGPYLGPGLITAGSSLPNGTGSWNFAVRIGLVNATLLDEPTKIELPLRLPAPLHDRPVHG